MPSRADAALARVRKLCLALPEVSERASHGAPTFFVQGKKSFASFLDNHHGDGRLALWCAASPDAQAMLVDSDPEVFFVPPYVGHLGWVGVRLDRAAPWPVIARVVEEAYQARAPRKARSDREVSSRGSTARRGSARSTPSARRSRS